MDIKERANHTLNHGNKWPYDGRTSEPEPKDWAHRAARGVMADLCDRRGIKSELELIEEDVAQDIVETIAEIIRQAAMDDPQQGKMEREGKAHEGLCDQNATHRAGKAGKTDTDC